MSEEKLIKHLNLQKHPEGGYYYENYRSALKTIVNTDSNQVRNIATSIFFLLRYGEISAFHQLKSDEIWYFHYGSPLRVHFITLKGNLEEHILGIDLANYMNPQLIIPAGTIFGAEVLKKRSFTLFGCVVTPGFDFKDFKIFKRNDLLKKYKQFKDVINRMTID